MKKVFALLFVAGMFTLASCDSKKTEEAVDSTTAVLDSAATMVDSASAVVDSATAVVDSVAK